MRNLYTLTKREFGSYWWSPIAYVVIAVFLVIQGYTFWLLMNSLNSAHGTVTTDAVMEFFFGDIFFWFCLLLITPLITMRLISDEIKSGTFELLMTAPVTDSEVVLSKFFGAYIFYLVLWIPTLSFAGILKYYINPGFGPIWASYLGTALLGAVLISIGTFTSALTKNQIIAAILSFFIILAFFSIGFLNSFISDQTSRDIISYISILDHYMDFSRGIVDTRHIIYYLSFTSIMLFFTVKAIESRKWRYRS
ncbi:MAG: ABC transporter permease subunit [Candidatus Firestonebacteria bacterium]|nr:ABC transporter permease subunit [Candidatus Firestonebacteria bacterium]